VVDGGDKHVSVDWEKVAGRRRLRNGRMVGAREGARAPTIRS
jgi:hypothetical protein